jgi:AraC-like DNA-binding protein
VADRTKPPTSTTAGILRPEEFAQHVDLSRWPADDLDRWVEYFWGLRWSLPPGSSYLSAVVPHPAVNLTVERAAHPRPGLAEQDAVVTGVVTRRFDTLLQGDGAVVGAKFRPGGLAALTGRSARDWTDRDVPVDEVLPAAVDALRAADPHEQDPAAISGALVPLTIGAADDPTYDRVLEVVADMLADRSLVSVAQVEERHAVSGRTLQRWFAHYVGVGPKWVLARHRLHDAVTELDAGYDGPLSELAARYGWYDQSHFVRDFRSLTGVPPGEYAGRAQPSGAQPSAAQPSGKAAS